MTMTVRVNGRMRMLVSTVMVVVVGMVMLVKILIVAVVVMVVIVRLVIVFVVLGLGAVALVIVRLHHRDFRRRDPCPSYPGDVDPHRVQAQGGDNVKQYGCGHPRVDAAAEQHVARRAGEAIEVDESFHAVAASHLVSRFTVK
jgi:hypothetical protein